MRFDERVASQPELLGLPPVGADLLEREASWKALEEALAPEEAGVVVLVGAAGMGKTTLLTQVAMRLRGSERFERVVYTSYAGGGLAELALRDLAAVLLGGRHEHKPVAMNRLMEALAEQPTLVCWDDLDAVIGEGPMGLSDVMQQELLALAERLATVGSTRVLLTCSRVPTHPSLVRGRALHVSIGRLTPEEAVGLWARCQFTDQVEDEAVARLAEHLGGNPMALRLAGDMASSHGLEATERALEDALPGFGQGEGKLGNQGLHAAMEAWLRQLPRAYDEALTPMGLFTRGFVANLPARVGEVPETTWAEALGALVRAGLARTEPIAGLKVPYVTVHGAFVAHLARRLDQSQGMMLRIRYAGNYVGLVNWMTKNRERAAEAVGALRHCEMPNLRRTLPILIASGEMGLAREFTRRMADLLQEEGLHQEAGLVRDAVGRAVSELLRQERPLSRVEVHLLLEQADSLMESRRYGEAGMLLRRVCDRFGKDEGVSYTGSPATFDQAKACRRLGRALITLRQGDLALSPLVQAELLLDKIEGQEGVGDELLELALDLAPLYLAHDQPDKARKLWEKALPLAEAAERSEDIARLRQQLAGAAMRAQDVTQAEEHLQAALDALAAGADVPQLEAELLDHLAAVAFQRGARDRAIDALERAVAAHRAQKNRPAEAAGLVRLAGLLKEEGRAQEAEPHLARAAAIYQEGGQRPALATVELEMAQLLLDEGRTSEARVHAEAARAILEDPKMPGPLWRAYVLLEELERRAGDKESAADWHVSAVEAYAGSASARGLLARWAPLLAGLVQACRGQALENEVVVALEEMEQEGEWRETVDAFWRVLGGERGDDLYLSLDVRQAALVKALLAGLEAPEPEEQEPPAEAAAQAPSRPQAAVGGVPREVQATIQRVFTTVLQAARGDANARFVADMLLGTLQEKGRPEPLVHYARAMERILAGERDPALAQGLPKELAEPVRALLTALSKDASLRGQPQ